MRFGTDAATPRRKVFGPDGNGVTRASEKTERTAAGAGGRRRRKKASARFRTAAKASATTVGRRRRREKASARSRTAAKAGTDRATVRIFPSGTARCFGIVPRGKRFTPAKTWRTMIASPSRAAGMVATESRRNAQANRRQPRWRGERSPKHRKPSVTSHPDTAIASRTCVARARTRPGSNPGPRLRASRADRPLSRRTGTGFLQIARYWHRHLDEGCEIDH